MLKTLRDNLRHLHWVLWIVILAFIAIAFAGIGPMGPPGLGDAAASVGDAEVSYAEFERQYQNLERQYSEMFGDRWDRDMAEQFGLARQALEQLITSKVLLLEARRLGLEVTDAEVQEEILTYPAFQDPSGQFIGAERYSAFLRRMGYTPETFEAAVRQDILTRRMQQILAQNVYLSEGDVERAYREQVEKARIRYLQMPASRFAEEATAGDEELRAHLEANPDQYQLPERRDVAYLLVDRNLMGEQLEIPEEELRAHYEANEAEFTRDEQVQARHVLLRTGGERTAEEARRELEAVRQRVEGGEDFAAVAREVSEDPQSARRGGDLGWFSRGQMVPEFEEAAFGAQEGELVGPVESPFGVHLILVTGHREAGLQPFEEVRQQVRFQLAQERLADLAQERAGEVARQLREDEGGPTVDAMRELAEGDDALFLYEPDPFGLGDAVAGLGRAPDFTDAAFNMEDGELSGPVEVPRGWAVILVQEALPPRAAELAEVEDEVRRAVEAEKRKEMAVERLREARGRLDAGESLEQVAEELELEVQESEPFGAGASVPGLGAVPGLASSALGMDVGGVGGPVETSRGAVLYEVSERTRFDPARFAEEKEQTREQLLAERAQSLLASLLQQRRDELGVNYNRQVVEQFNLDGAAGTGGAEG